MSTLTLDVVMDIVCPWCFLGKRRLDAALASLPDVATALTYRAFQLDGTIPPRGLPRGVYLRRKFGDERRLDEPHRRLKAMGAEVGIAFAFDRITVAPNTFDAHRLIHFAAAEGKADAVVERLFALYFEEGEDIGDPAVLARAGVDAGLDAEAVAADLAGDRARDTVRSEIDFAGRIGVTGVPCTIIGGRHAISGAQPVEVLANAIRRLAA